MPDPWSPTPTLGLLLRFLNFLESFFLCFSGGIGPRKSRRSKLDNLPSGTVTTPRFKGLMKASRPKSEALTHWQRSRIERPFRKLEVGNGHWRPAAGPTITLWLANVCAYSLAPSTPVTILQLLAARFFFLKKKEKVTSLNQFT